MGAPGATSIGAMPAATLHLPTIALCCAVSSLFFAMVLGSLRNPWVRLQGSHCMAAGAACSGLTYALVIYEVSGNTLWVQVLRTTASVALYALLAAGLCRLRGRRTPWLLLLGSLTLMALLAALYPNQAPDVAPRMLGSAVLSSGWALFAIWLLLVPQPRLPGPGPWSAALGLAVMVTAYALRAATLLADGQVTPAETASGPANAPLLLASQFALLLSLGGLAVMWNARVVQEVAQLATHDSLTGLLNRRGFNLHWPAWRATHGPGWALLLDLDRFKQINDQLGHETGDAVLQWLAECMHRVLPPRALMARQGGDEFLVLLPAYLHAAQVQAQVDLLLGRFQEGLQERWPAAAEVAGLSAGFAPMGDSLSDSVRRADAAMYSAKQSRRGRAVEGA